MDKYQMAQKQAVDTAVAAIQDLRDKPNTPLMYAAYGLLDALITMVEESGDRRVDGNLREHRATLQAIIDAS